MASREAAENTARRAEIEDLIADRLEQLELPQKYVYVQTRGSELTKVTIRRTLETDVTPGEQGG